MATKNTHASDSESASDIGSPPPEEVITILERARLNGTILPPEDLANLMAMIHEYQNSPNRNAPPTLFQFRRAVQAIFKRGDPLSSRWNKEQLAACLHCWVCEAIALKPFHLQTDLYAEVKVEAGNPKKFKHNVYLYDAKEGKVSTFVVQSPKPKGHVAACPHGKCPRVTGEKETATSPPKNEDDGQKTPDEPIFTPNSQFERDLKELAGSPTLAAMSLETPRVENPPKTPESSDVNPAKKAWPGE